MTTEIVIPEVGESISEGTIVCWFKRDGELVEKDEPLLEFETDKITLPVVAQATGRISISVQGGEVRVGQVVGSIEETVEATTATTTREEISDRNQPSLAPAVRRIVRESRVDLKNVEGTGRGGRITKGDVLGYLGEERAVVEGEAAAAAERSISGSASADDAPPEGDARGGRVISVLAPGSEIQANRDLRGASANEPSMRETREKMSNLRRRLAERLCDIQREAAILTTFNEVDMSGVLSIRRRHQERFLKRYGVKLGLMSFFAKASVHALKAVAKVNARIEGDEIVQHHYYDIGIAIGTEKGLVVPVLRDVDRLGLGEIELGIADLGHRARERKLELSDLSGGVFSISNGGIYGSLMSTPILNPPQSAILGVHGIKKRVIAVGQDDEMAVRPMMYLALSYDHRLVDGADAVTFLRTIVEVLAEPERLLLEV